MKQTRSPMLLEIRLIIERNVLKNDALITTVDKVYLAKKNNYHFEKIYIYHGSQSFRSLHFERKTGLIFPLAAYRWIIMEYSVCPPKAWPADHTPLPRHLLSRDTVK